MILQSHTGSGDNIAGDKINKMKNVIFGSIISGGNVTIGDGHNSSKMNNKQLIQNAISKGDIDEALAILDTFSNDAALLMSRWSSLKREKRLGIIEFSNEQLQRNWIVSAILSYAECDSDVISTQRPMQTPQGLEPQLLQIIRENDRKNPEAAKRALTLLDSFRSYHDLKKTRSFFDRSGEKLQEIQDEFEAFKKTLNKSESESVEKFIDRVASLIDAKIPDWPSIKEAFVLCLGRSGASSFGHMQIEQLERIIENQPSDDDAKLKIVYSIETFLGQL